ncbi:ATP-grasp domain-containing protein [Curtobacterium sp. MCPF17_031]|uniref:preATP grasp domain-containing protein n=1 Tax=Curtobacterium sp. MCPF17_031 TaxID=2175653 RepID=UPI000DA74E6F|nr:ATP-grasp domain-containing protein [Curtobacterium sp. MCPF17_031]PZE34234.1 hypothetical protein DEJ31_15165 [Curtobacterium sp. MCPF17_031]
MDFIQRVKKATTGAAASRTMLLANFEVEESWAEGETTLPRVGSENAAAIVNRMDEFGIWLAEGEDTVLLKEAPDPAYLEGIERQGFEVPKMLVVGQHSPMSKITTDARNNPSTLREASRLAGEGVMMLPHSLSVAESDLCRDIGIAVAGPSDDVCRRVNGKVFSRRLADSMGIRQPAGVATEDLDDWKRAVESARSLLQDGRTAVVKEAYGVSGKGIAVVKSEQRLNRLDAIVTQRAESNGGRAMFSVEEWVNKSVDLNFQFTLGRDGATHFDFIKLAETARGVHLGHSYPAALSAAHVDEIELTAERIASKLRSEGYFGVVGVDSIIDDAGVVYPMLEINARFNMSTYQAKIDQRVDAQNAVARAKHFTLQLGAPLTYLTLQGLLAECLFTAERPAGLVINNFATVNAAFGDGDFEAQSAPAARPRASTQGRLYGVIVGQDAEAVDRLDAEISARLERSYGRAA